MIKVQIYLMVLIFGILLFQGLPIGDPDDWEHLLASEDASSGTLTRNFLLPWSTSKVWVGQTDPERILNKRLFHTMALKVIHQFFDYAPFPHYFFLKGLFFSGTCTLLFLLLLKVTKNLFFSFWGALFFITVPAHYSSFLWISDSTTLLQFFLILGLYAFLKGYANLEAKGPSIHFWGGVSVLLFSGWIAIKTKETAVILPFALIIYLLSGVRLLKTSPLKWLLLFFVLGIVAFQVIPIGHVFDEGQQRFRFEPETVKRMLFRNYDCGYEDEKVSAFFSLEHVWPVSVARTLGFFPLWLLVISLIVTLLRIFDLNLRASKHRMKNGFLSPLVKISLIWIVTESILFGYFQPDPRYFSTIMIPITIFVFKFLEFAAGLWNQRVRRMLQIAVVGAFAWTLFQNTQHILWLRSQIGQRSNRFLNVAKIIYRDLFPNEPMNMRKLGLFFCPSYRAPDTGPRFKEFTYYVPLGYGQWNRTETPELNDFIRHARQGTPYLATYDDVKFRHASIKKIGTISGINDSFLEKMIYGLKKKKIPALYVLKYNS